MAQRQVNPLLWLGLVVAVLFSLFPSPQKSTPGKVKAPERTAKSIGLSAQEAKALIVRRDLFQPLVEESKTPEEPQGTFPQTPLLFPELPAEKPPFNASLPGSTTPPPAKQTPLSGLVLRGVVESEQGKFALLEGPSFPAAYVAEGQSQGHVKVKKIGPDWAEVEAQGERKTLRLPGEFSVEPLSKKTGGGQ